MKDVRVIDGLAADNLPISELIEEGEPAILRTDLLPGWARATLGMVETSAGPALLIDPAQLVAGPQDKLHQPAEKAMA